VVKKGISIDDPVTTLIKKSKIPYVAIKIIPNLKIFTKNSHWISSIASESKMKNRKGRKKKLTSNEIKKPVASTPLREEIRTQII